MKTNPIYISTDRSQTDLDSDMRRCTSRWNATSFLRSRLFLQASVFTFSLLEITSWSTGYLILESPCWGSPICALFKDHNVPNYGLIRLPTSRLTQVGGVHLLRVCLNGRSGDAIGCMDGPCPEFFLAFIWCRGFRTELGPFRLHISMFFLNNFINYQSDEFIHNEPNCFDIIDLNGVLVLAGVL